MSQMPELTGYTFLGIDADGRIVSAAVQYASGLREDDDAVLRRFCQRGGSRGEIRTRKLTNDRARAYMDKHGWIET